MGMRISGSSNVSSSQSTTAAAWQQRQQSVKDMFTSLQSGDLSGAQKAFAAINGGKSQVNANGPLADIGKALQSGDLAGAQKAAQDFQAKRSGGHHHHHSEQAAATTAAASTAGTPLASSGTGSLLNIVA